MFSCFMLGGMNKCKQHSTYTQSTIGCLHLKLWTVDQRRILESGSRWFLRYEISYGVPQQCW